MLHGCRQLLFRNVWLTPRKGETSFSIFSKLIFIVIEKSLREGKMREE